MKTSVTLEYQKNCLVNAQELSQIELKLKPEIERIQDIIHQGYATDYASINALYDDQALYTIKRVIDEKKKLKPTMLVVIGIGGSNLGTAAVQQALYGSLYNEKQPALKVYYADTVDTDHIADIIVLVEQELQRKGTVLLNVVSKSGSTTETIANFEVLLAVLKKYVKDAYKYVVVTTDKDSALWHVADQEFFTRLEIPQKIGGRYSVFSAVGLFPLGIMGVHIDDLCAGARNAVHSCTDTTIVNNNAALSAAILYTSYKRGITLHDTFLFSVDLENMGKWYRQLMGESIGKEYDRAGNHVQVGITPTVSIGSTDLHSVAQLYLGGPADKITAFVTVGKHGSNVVVPEFSLYERLVPSIQGAPLMAIMDAIVRGTQLAYQKNKRPFVTWHLPAKNAWSIGQFLQCKMLEIMYLGFLLDINPFDQPNVESYKQETRKILAHE